MVRRLVEPNQVDTSNEYGGILSPVALRQLREAWQHLFRRVILELLPANALAAHFHDVMGRPTKELYSVAGLLLIKEFMDWTVHRLTVALEIHLLIERFSKHAVFGVLPSYQMMAVVFDQQCEVKPDKIEVRKASGGNIVTFPAARWKY